jgi:hypothetical protein
MCRTACETQIPIRHIRVRKFCDRANSLPTNRCAGLPTPFLFLQGHQFALSGPNFLRANHLSKRLIMPSIGKTHRPFSLLPLKQFFLQFPDYAIGPALATASTKENS